MLHAFGLNVEALRVVGGDEEERRDALSSSAPAAHAPARAPHCIRDTAKETEVQVSGTVNSKTGLERLSVHIASSTANAVQFQEHRRCSPTLGDVSCTQLTCVVGSRELEKMGEGSDYGKEGDKVDELKDAPLVVANLSLRRSPRLGAGGLCARASEQLLCGGYAASAHVQLENSAKESFVTSTDHIRDSRSPVGGREDAKDASSDNSRSVLLPPEREASPSLSASLVGARRWPREVSVEEHGVTCASVSTAKMPSQSSQYETMREPAPGLQLSSRDLPVHASWTVTRCIPYIRSLARRAGWERVPPSLLLLLVKDLQNAIARSGVDRRATSSGIDGVPDRQASAGAEGKRKKRRFAEVERLLQVQNEWARAKTVSLWKKARRGLGDGESLKDVLTRLRGKPSILSVAGSVYAEAL